jgi:hypothetical protein
MEQLCQRQCLKVRELERPFRNEQLAPATTPKVPAADQRTVSGASMPEGIRIEQLSCFAAIPPSDLDQRRAVFESKLDRVSKQLVIVMACVAVAIAAGVFWLLRTRDSEFPLIYNPASFVSAEEIRLIEQVVRGRGERYVVSINIVSTNKAGATTGHGSHRARSGRTYDLSRTAGGWRIDAVEEWKN